MHMLTWKVIIQAIEWKSQKGGTASFTFVIKKPYLFYIPCKKIEKVYQTSKIKFLQKKASDPHLSSLEELSNDLDELDLFAVRKFHENNYQDYSFKQDISQGFKDILSTYKENTKSK